MERQEKAITDRTVHNYNNIRNDHIPCRGGCMDTHHQMSPMCHVHQHKIYRNIHVLYMAGINRALLCLVKDAIGKELGEP